MLSTIAALTAAGSTSRLQRGNLRFRSLKELSPNLLSLTVLEGNHVFGHCLNMLLVHHYNHRFAKGQVAFRKIDQRGIIVTRRLIGSERAYTLESNTVSQLITQAYLVLWQLCCRAANNKLRH